MKHKYLFLDFEYNQSIEENVNLVCCVTQAGEGEPETWWLHNNKLSQQNLANYLAVLNEEGYIFVSYAVMAEARSFLSLGLDPSKFKWIDLYLEWRNTINHNHLFAYGDQYIDGKVITTKPPKDKWFTGEDKDNHSKTPTGLSGAVYKLLGTKIDTDHKTAMRDLIISNPKEFTQKGS